MDHANLSALLRTVTSRLTTFGAEVGPLVCEPPATEAQVLGLEEQLGLHLPSSFRRGLLTLSSEVDFRWFAPRDHSFPEPFRPIFGGQLRFGLEATAEAETARRGWVRECFSDASHPYDAVWHDKIGIATVENGDVIAIDCLAPTAGRVVYLSHDDGEGHDDVLADDILDLVDRLSPLAFVGPEDWQWRVFCSTWASGIEPDTPRATAWRALLGLGAVPMGWKRPPPDGRDERLCASLLEAWSAGPESASGGYAASRALGLCRAEQVDVVVRLARVPHAGIQVAAVAALVRLRVEALDLFVEIALVGGHNGRLAAIRAIRDLRTPAAEAALARLRETLGVAWVP